MQAVRHAAHRIAAGAGDSIIRMRRMRFEASLVFPSFYSLPPPPSRERLRLLRSVPQALNNSNWHIFHFSLAFLGRARCS